MMHYYFFNVHQTYHFYVYSTGCSNGIYLTRVIDCVKCVLAYAFGDKFMNIFANTMVNGTNLTKNLYREK